MTRVLFLGSGGGGNFRFVRRCVEAGLLDGIELSGVVGDRSCGALDAAEDAGVAARRVSYSRDDNRELLTALRELSPDRIVTTFDRILDAKTVDAFAGKMINLHYSLLPAYSGLTGPAPVRRALENGCRILGTTVHVVLPLVDSGPILSQSALPVRDGEDFAATLQRVFRSGAVNLAGALSRRDSAGGSAWSYRADLESFFAPGIDFPEGTFAERFWDSVR